MTVFTVHQPPARNSEDVTPPDRFAFVRDGFYFWAFVFGPIWMIWYRMWLTALIYGVALIALHATLWALGLPALVKVAVTLLVAVLVGFEAGTLRRWTLRRWVNRGTVVAYNREAAEHRFFDRWSGHSEPDESARYAMTGPIPSTRVPTSDSDIVGLFPQPHARL